MATIFTDDQNYKDIADAIRAKNGSTDTYTPSEMPEAINAIETSEEPVSAFNTNYASEVRKYLPMYMVVTSTPNIDNNITISPETTITTRIRTADNLLGNATANDVLAGKTFISDNVITKTTGTAELSTSVDDTGLITATCGNASMTHQLSSSDDANFLAKNIKSGVSIFGITGSLDSTHMGYSMYQLEPGGWTTDGVIDTNGTISFELADGYFSAINIEVFDEDDEAFWGNFLIVANGSFEENQTPILIQIYTTSGKTTLTTADMISQFFSYDYGTTNMMYLNVDITMNTFIGYHFHTYGIVA